MTLISSIYSRGPSPNPASESDRNQAARAAVWHEHGVAVIDPDDVTDDWTRQAIENEAVKLYGRRQP